MNNKRKILTNSLSYVILKDCITSVFFILVGVLFCFKYNYQLLHVEQLQIFQFTSLYWNKYIAVPGGVSAYIGEFFTQFYYINRLGGIIIILFLFLIYLLQKFLLKIWNLNKNFSPLLLFLCAIFSIYYMDVNACLGGAISVLLALLISICLIAIKNNVVRWSLAPFVFILAYWFCGGGVFVFTGLMVINEFRNCTKMISFFISILYVIYTVSIPLFVRQYIVTLPWTDTWFGPSFYNAQVIPDLLYVILSAPIIAFVIISIMNKIKWINKLYYAFLLLLILIIVMGYVKCDKINQEDFYELDYYVRHEKWDEIITLGEQKKHKNALFTSYTNLALAQKGRLSSDMFNFFQRLDGNVFWTSDYYPMYMTGEIYYYLDMAQTARAFFFMANTQSPKSQTVFLYKRLAEIELLTGNFDLAEKYIYTLKQTLFYRKLADKLEQIRISKKLPADMLQKKKNQPVNNGFFATNFKYNLLVQYSGNKNNHFVFDYLMMELMLENDFTTFLRILNESNLSTSKTLPVSYQQFILMYAYLINDNSLVAKYSISYSIVETFYDYMKINQQNLSPDRIREQLEKEYGNTYWFYAQYINKIKNAM